jgi:hypothetical protein
MVLLRSVNSLAKGLARKGWDVDLAYGEAGEELIRKIFSGEVKVEVKRDDQAVYTSHIYIELTYKGAPSGINTTEADWWIIFYAPTRFVCLKTEDLRGLVRRAIRINKVVPGGDNNETTGALVPLDWMMYDFRD